MNVQITPTYQISFVVLSYILAFIGSFAALTNARRIVNPNGTTSISNAAITGLALGGIGVWSMHFIGMVALKLGMGTAYSLLETIVSLVAAIVASSVALAYVARAPERIGRILIAGTLLGLGVALMHYLGMLGMRFGGFIEWSYDVVALSILIAVAAASAALWLAFNTRTVGVRLLAAAVMGVAVCAMHYTGMSAAGFICTTTDRHAIPGGIGVVSAHQMPVWVIALSLTIALVIGLKQFVQFAEEAPGSARSAR